MGAGRSKMCEPGANRTRNLQLRRLLLYPFELRARCAQAVGTLATELQKNANIRKNRQRRNPFPSLRRRQIPPIFLSMKISPGYSLIGLMLCMAAATFWPFNFGQENNAGHGLAGGLVLTSYSTAYTPLPPAKLARSGNFTLVLQVSAWPFQGRSCVVDYATQERHFNLRVEQNDDNIIFSVATPGKKPILVLTLPHAFDNGDTITAGISSDGRSLSAWHSHGASKRTDLPRGFSLRWDSAATITFGSCVTGWNPWHGVVHFLAFFDRTLSLDEVADGSYRTPSSDPVLLYRFPPDLSAMTLDKGRSPQANLAIPPHYLEPGREFLQPPWTAWGGRYELYDILQNIVGFLPFGFLVARALRRPGRGIPALLLLTATAACLFSLFIEVTQYAIPIRDSSLLDVISNTLGGLAGGWVALLVWFDRALRRVGVRFADETEGR